MHAASIQDHDGAKLLAPWLIIFGWLKVVFVDGGYAGALAQECDPKAGIEEREGSSLRRIRSAANYEAFQYGQALSLLVITG